MDNFRRRTRDSQRQAIDSILSGPHRSPDARRSFGRRPVRLDGFEPSGRRVDDFRRPEGYHAVQQGTVRTSVAPPATTKKKPETRQASLLHMTLPNSGGLGPSKRERRATRHGRWRTIRKWTLRSTLALAALVLLVGGVLVTKGFFKLHKVFKGGGTAVALQKVTPDLLNGEGDGRVNILLLGKGGPGHEGPDLTDTLIVASVDPLNKTATLVSVPRDLWVSVSSFSSSSSSTKINSVYANAKSRSFNLTKDKDKAERAGVDAIEQMVSQVLGIPIHYYTMIDFTAFKQAVDTVGGVTVDVPSDLVDYTVAWENKGSPVIAKKGLQTFDGKQALLYVRSRHGSARGDFDRTERQRLVIAALSQKVLSAGTYTNPLKISQLMSAFGDHISTDLSVNNALRLAQIGKDMNLSQLQSVGLADPPNDFVTTGNINGLSVVLPKAGVGDYSDIQNYIRNTLKDPYLAKENAAVTILNGTGIAGRATTMSDKLKSYGYNVTGIGDAPTQDYATTVLVDVSGGKKPFTKNYLEKRLNVKTVSRLPDNSIQPGTNDFVIILGQND